MRYKELIADAKQDLYDDVSDCPDFMLGYCNKIKVVGV